MVFHKKSFQFAKTLFFGQKGGPTQFTVPIGTAKTFAVKGLQTFGKVAKFFAPKTPKQAIIGLATIPAGIGLATTEFGRKTLKTIFNPFEGFKRGQATPEFIGGVIGDVKKGKPPSDLAGALKTAGVIGGAGVLGGAGIVLGKKALERFKRKDPLLGTVPFAPFPVTSQALQPVKQIPVERPLEVKPPKPVQIKNIFKPSVDIRFSKTRKFINQQVLIK